MSVAGYSRTDVRYGDGIGSEFQDAGFFTHYCRKDYDTTRVLSKIKSDNSGYTMEYGINLGAARTKGDGAINNNGEFGIGIKIYDKDSAGSNYGIVNFETINDNMHNTMRCLSNWKLVGYVD